MNLAALLVLCVGMLGAGFFLAWQLKRASADADIAHARNGRAAAEARRDVEFETAKVRVRVAERSRDAAQDALASILDLADWAGPEVMIRRTLP